MNNLHWDRQQNCAKIYSGAYLEFIIFHFNWKLQTTPRRVNQSYCHLNIKPSKTEIISMPWMSSFQFHFNLFHFLCVFLFLRYASSVILWMDHESLITFKLAFPSLCLASILCCWCLLIPPCKSSCSSCYINALTSTSIPSNIMLYNKQ